MFVLGILLLSAPAQTTSPTAYVATASVAEDPFQALWEAAGPPAMTTPNTGPAPAPDRVPAPARLQPEMPGAPRLEDRARILVAQPARPRIPYGPPRTRWYGLPIVVADVLLAGLGFTGLAVDSPALTATGALGYAFVSPAIHWAQGNQNGGVWSAALHSLAPLTFGLGGGMFGSVVNELSCAGGNCGRSDLPWFYAGAAFGVLSATVIDAVWTAYVDEPPPTTSLHLFRSGDVTAVGLGGQF